MKLYLKRGVIFGFVLALGIIGGLGVYSYITFQNLINTATLLSHATRVINAAESVLVNLIDLETGQRGFVISGDETYLRPYDSALRVLDHNVDRLTVVTADYPDQSTRVEKLVTLIKIKKDIVTQTVEKRRKGFEEAQALINTGQGMKIMDQIRAIIGEIKEEESEAFQAQNMITSKALTRFQYAFSGLLISPALVIVLLFYTLNEHLTKREKAERKLHLAAAEIMHLNSELEAFTYSVSHDLRAPLRSVNGYAEILKEDYSKALDEEGRRVINVIINNARRMGQLIDDLLDFSKLGRKEIIKSQLGTQNLVNGLLEEFQVQNGESKTKIKVLPLLPVNADSRMIRQVWFNLISNALKYSSKKEEPSIEIGSYSNETEICYYVKDNGVGFNMAYNHKLFGVFQRLHKLEEFEGSGVGLALAKRIITRHGGRIWAEAVVNEGATFYFSLPK